MSIVKKSRADIEKIRTVKEATRVKKMADAAIEFYRAQDDHDTAQKVKEISMRSARKAGELLAEVPRNPGAGGHQRSGSPTIYTSLIDDSGISKTTAENWQKLAGVPDEKFEEYFAEAAYMNWEYSVASLMRFSSGRSSRVHLEWCECPKCGGRHVKQ